MTGGTIRMICKKIPDWELMVDLLFLCKTGIKKCKKTSIKIVLVSLTFGASDFILIAVGFDTSNIIFCKKGKTLWQMLI